MSDTLGVPVLVGGVGGSGTRVVAEMLSSRGFFLGEKLNASNDTLDFAERGPIIHRTLRGKADQAGEPDGGDSPLPYDRETEALITQTLVTQVERLRRAAAARHCGRRWGAKDPTIFHLLRPLSEA